MQVTLILSFAVAAVIATVFFLFGNTLYGIPIGIALGSVFFRYREEGRVYREEYERVGRQRELALRQLMEQRGMKYPNDAQSTPKPSMGTSVPETQAPIEQTSKRIKIQILWSNVLFASGLACLLVGVQYPDFTFWPGLLLLSIGAVWRFVVIPSHKWWIQG